MQTHLSRLLPRRAMLCALLPLAALTAAGCGKHADTPTGAASSGLTSSGGTTARTVSADPVAPVSAGLPVSDSDAKQFADRLLTAIKSGDTATLNGLLDLDAIGAASLAGLDLPDTDKTAFIGGVRNSLNQSSGITSQLVQSVAGGGSSGLLRFVEVDGRKRARIRMVHPNLGGVGYVDFVLGHNGAGQTLAQDLYIFYSGELLSTTMHRLAVQGAASQNRSLLDKLRGVDNDFAKHISELQSITQNVAMGNAAAALQTYNSLPDTLKADKTMKLIRVRIGEKLGEADYERALSDFRASFPTDPATSLLSVDFYLLKKQYGKTLTAIDTLDKALGGDPYLDVMRAEVYMIQHDRSKAKSALDRAMHALPDDKGAQQLKQALSR